MQFRIRFLFAAVLGAVLLAWLPLTMSRSAAQTTPTVQIRQDATAGSILAGPDGKTLYTFSTDSAGVSTCADACANAWPPLVLDSGQPTAGPGLSGTLAVITRADGKRQVTYNGQPLYNFVRDTQAGVVTGEGVTAFGGTFHLARPAGAAAAAPAAAAPAATARATATAAAPAGPTTAQRAAPPAAPAVAPAAARALPATGSGGQLDGPGGNPWLIGALLVAALLSGSCALLLRRSTVESPRRR